MKKEYDFSKGKRGAVISQKGKTRVTIYIDNKILNEFRKRADAAGYGYQTLINEALKEHVSMNKETLEDKIRRIVREETASI